MSLDPQLIDQGLQLLGQSKPLEAERIFACLVAENEHDANSLYYLSLSQAEQGRLDEARTGFEQALRLEPRHADACFEIAAIYLKTREYQAALSCANRGLGISPSHNYGLDLSGTIHFLMGSRIEALRCWNRLNRPHLMSLQVCPTGMWKRQRIAQEIQLLPGDLLTAGQIEVSRAPRCRTTSKSSKTRTWCW